MSCTIEDIQKLGLRVATIVAAQPVEGSEKLVKLQVDLGTEKRQIVAGIGKSYAPDQLIGTQIVLVSNLEPRTIFGVESNGMLLAANGDDRLVVIGPSLSVPSGSTIQ